ncbi:MAG TPA: hypothetical protein VHW92_04040 [Mycobacteriales bacterium]|jgi:hypothetical protein|nr:hypothetical protein [Mycobacteriales bacterium]
MTHTPLPLAQDWAEQVTRDGSVTLGSFSEPALRAADLDIGQARAQARELKSSFERLDPDEQLRAVAAAPAIDPPTLAVLTTASSDPLVRGSWNNTPPWFRPLTESFVSTLRGVMLPDGSMASLDAATDLVASRVSVTIRTLPDQAQTFAAQYFSPDPPLPVDATPGEGWTDETGGGLAVMTLVWPHGRGTRALNWRITRTSGKSETAFLQTRRDYGFKRSVDETVNQAEFAGRLQAALEQAWAQAR